MTKYGLTFEQYMINKEKTGKSTGVNPYIEVTYKGKKYLSVQAFCTANPQYSYKYLIHALKDYDLTFEQVIANIDATGRASGRDPRITVKGTTYRNYIQFCKLNPEYDEVKLHYLKNKTNLSYEETIDRYNELITSRQNIRGCYCYTLAEFFKENPEFDYEKTRNKAIEVGVSMIRLLNMYDIK